MDDLGTRIEILSLTGKGYAREFAVCPFSLEDTHRIETGRMGSKGTGDPVDGPVLADNGPFRIEVVHIFGPVFDCRIGQRSIVTYEEFDAAGMEVGHVVFRCRTAFDEVDFGTFFDDDHGVFELACTRCIETEIALQGNGHIDTGRYVDEGATRPDGAVEGSEFMIRRRHEFHEMGLDDIFVLFQCRIKIRIDDALLHQFVLDAVVDDFRVVLGADAGQGCLLRFGDAQAVERIFDIVGNVIPVGFHLCVRADVSDDIVHIEFTDIRTPVGIFHVVKNIE